MNSVGHAAFLLSLKFAFYSDRQHGDAEDAEKESRICKTQNKTINLQINDVAFGRIYQGFDYKAFHKWPTGTWI